MLTLVLMETLSMEMVAIDLAESNKVGNALPLAALPSVVMASSSVLKSGMHSLSQPKILLAVAQRPAASFNNFSAVKY